MVVKSSSTPTSRAIRASKPFHIPLDLPLPTRSYGRSHAKNKGTDHIPRARNPFLLFRAYFMKTLNPLPQDIPYCNDQSQVSRIVTYLWVLISPEERGVFYRLLEEEKKRHAERYSSYKYIPGAAKLPHATIERCQDESVLCTEDLAALRIARVLREGFHGEALAVKICAIIADIGSPEFTRKALCPTPAIPRYRPGDSSSPSYQPITIRISPRCTRAKSSAEAAELEAALAASQCMEELASLPPSSPSITEYSSMDISTETSLSSYSRAISPADESSSSFDLEELMVRPFDDEDNLDFSFSQDDMLDNEEAPEFDAFYWEEQANQSYSQETAALQFRGRTPFDPRLF